MKAVPCEQDEALRKKIEDLAEILKTEAHKLGTHGIPEKEFYESGLFRGAIESIRGSFSASMREKRELMQHILNYLQDKNLIRDWASSGAANRHDYSITMPSGKVAIVELKGCLDGNNTTIYERPANANEFYIWSVCQNAGADPQHNVWSGIHTRLGADIIAREQQVDGLIVWDMVCASLGRPCPKVKAQPDRLTTVGHYMLPPPCIYLFPATVPHVRNNPKPKAQSISDTSFLRVLHECFKGKDEELNYVDFEVEYKGSSITRKTSIRRSEEVLQSRATTIRRT